jgi:hypothetical protein
LFASPQNIIGKLLSHQTLTGIGLISYSAYLWHQPLFAFTKYRLVDAPSKEILFFLAALSILFGYFSWKFIETPFRQKQRFSQNKIFLLSAASCLVFIMIGVASNYTKGFYSRLNDSQKEILVIDSADYVDNLYLNIYRRGTCFLDAGYSSGEFKKECGSNESFKSTLIWGDSHAAALSFGLRKIFQPVSQFNSAACPPLVNVSINNSPNCQKINEFVINRIRVEQPKRIILHANWLIYDKYKIEDSLRNTIQTIKLTSPSSRVFIVGPVPQWEGSLPAVLISKNLNLNNEHFIINNKLDLFLKIDDRLNKIAKEENLIFLSSINQLCENNKCLATSKYKDNFSMLAWYYGHLTEAGSVLLTQKLFHNNQ